MEDKFTVFGYTFYKYNILNALLVIGGFILNFFLIVLGNMQFSVEITFVVFGLALLVLIIIFIVANIYHNLLIKDRFDRILENTFLQMGNSQFGYAVRSADDAGSCFRHKYHCCAIDFIQSDFYKYILNETEMRSENLKSYNLISADDFNIKEEKYFENHHDGEIWVISNALETEIEIDNENDEHVPDWSLRQSMEVVKKNIENGGKYVQFVSLGVHGEEDTEFLKRRQKYWEAKPGLKDDIERKKEMPVIRIDSDFIDVGMERDIYKDPDWAFMVKLTSTVIFIDENKHFREGYFCFRTEDSSDAEEFERRTILFEMPSYCMLDAIVKDLKNIKKHYLKCLELGEDINEKGDAHEQHKN